MKLASTNPSRNLEPLIRQYLERAKIMHLATISDGNPWVCNVWFAADEDMNIYWFSSTTRRHSQDVAKDPRVAGAMCLPKDPEEKGAGLQFEGIAEALDSEIDIQRARSVYVGRIFSDEQVDKFMANPERPHKFYRIKPSLFVLFDPLRFPDNPRQEWRPKTQK